LWLLLEGKVLNSTCPLNDAKFSTIKRKIIAIPLKVHGKYTQSVRTAKISEEKHHNNAYKFKKYIIYKWNK